MPGKQKKQAGKRERDIEKRIDRLDLIDFQLVKFCVACATLLILKLWPVTMLWVSKVNIWWFFAAMILFGARPFYLVWIKD